MIIVYGFVICENFMSEKSFAVCSKRAVKSLLF